MIVDVFEVAVEAAHVPNVRQGRGKGLKTLFALSRRFFGTQPLAIATMQQLEARLCDLLKQPRFMFGALQRFDQEYSEQRNR